MDELSPHQCFELLREEKVGHLGVISEGVPYVTPCSYVVTDNAIAMRVAEGRRVRAIRQNPAASFEVSRYDTETGDWSSVIAEGVMEIVEDDSTIQNVIAGLLAKYRPVVSTMSGQPMPMYTEVVVQLRIDTLTGRRMQARTTEGILDGFMGRFPRQGDSAYRRHLGPDSTADTHRCTTVRLHSSSRVLPRTQRAQTATKLVNLRVVWC